MKHELILTIKKHDAVHDAVHTGSTNQNSFMAPSIHCGINNLWANLS